MNYVDLFAFWEGGFDTPEDLLLQELAEALGKGVREIQLFVDMCFDILPIPNIQNNRVPDADLLRAFEKPLALTTAEMSALVERHRQDQCNHLLIRAFASALRESDESLMQRFLDLQEATRGLPMAGPRDK
jgi:hypothetical protein